MNVVTNLISRRGATGLPKRTIQLLAISMAMIGLVLGIAAPSQALNNPNIVVNGSFETGDFTGWTGQGNTTFNGVQCPGPGPTVADGNCSAFFGPVGSTGGIHQTLSTHPGELYLIDFEFEPDGGTPSSFSASFGGVTLLSLTNPPSSGLKFEHFAFTEIASGPSTTLQFDFRDDPGFLFLDAVSVQAPEPASLLLVGVGLGGVWLVRRRRIRG